MIAYGKGQRTFGWYRARLGKFTGSRVGDLMKSGRAKGEDFSDTAWSYIYAVAAERDLNPAIVDDDDLFGQYLEEEGGGMTKAMLWGREQEENALRLYAKTRGCETLAVESCVHDEIPYFAASPDAVVRHGDGTLHCVEVKCPRYATFGRYAAVIKDGDTLKREKPGYYWQTQAEMACTGARYCDFVAYSPWAANPLHVARIERNEDDIKTMLDRVRLAARHFLAAETEETA